MGHALSLEHQRTRELKSTFSPNELQNLEQIFNALQTPGSDSLVSWKSEIGIWTLIISRWSSGPFYPRRNEEFCVTFWSNSKMKIHGAFCLNGSWTTGFSRFWCKSRHSPGVRLRNLHFGRPCTRCYGPPFRLKFMFLYWYSVLDWRFMILVKCVAGRCTMYYKCLLLLFWSGPFLRPFCFMNFVWFQRVNRVTRKMMLRYAGRWIDYGNGSGTRIQLKQRRLSLARMHPILIRWIYLSQPLALEDNH